MRRFATAPSWGATRISTADQTRFFLKLDRFVGRRHRDTRWRCWARAAIAALGAGGAAGRAGTCTSRAAGATTGEVDHQMALLTRDGRRVSVGIMTSQNPSKAYGDRTLEGVARRLRAALGPDSVPR